ncbi:hypothetical protein NQ317_001031 [Molorchus minor]|uniref:Cytochrome c oxidase subunit n=1 Tax=Molorchus minor TaxID=1323400 RepID=A0ABQ9JFM2_9CUCU|nr:hypothetical protein NQ317_001031 [Molorchus minor]
MSKKDNEDEQKIETIPPDPRFQDSNVTRWCFGSYVDYHRCRRLFREKNPGCEQLSKIYKTICPNSWIERWEEQINIGTFPMDLPPTECNPKKK